MLLLAQVDFNAALADVLPTLHLRNGPAFGNEAQVLPVDALGIELPMAFDSGDVGVNLGTEVEGTIKDRQKAVHVAFRTN